MLAACGSLDQPPWPGAGLWSLDFSGDCAGRESERIHIAQLDEMLIAFGEFRLLYDEGVYRGTALFSAAMPADGRDIPYTISYSFTRADDGGFIGTQTIIEDGGHGLSCPVALRYLGRA